MITKRCTKWYGWRKDSLDARDLMLTLPPRTAPLPVIVDLRSDMPQIYNQGALGSCTANGIAAAFDFERRKQGNAFLTPSRLFVYYNERAIEGTIKQDSGAMIRDGIKTIAAQGVCAEKDWPYVIKDFAKKPSASCYKTALLNQAIKYQRVPQTAASLMACLATGLPVVFGFTVYAGFESAATARTGVVPMPRKGEAPLGGHCVVLCGYDLKRRLFTVRNSWGWDWGAAGYCFMPFDYVCDSRLASDFWNISLVE